MTTNGKSTVRRALITGLSGQDGSFLAELLLEKGYSVPPTSLVRGRSTRRGRAHVVRWDLDRVAHILAPNAT